MIEDYPDLKEKQKKHFLEKIQRNAQRLHALVEDLLALATLERAEPSLKLEKLDFYALIRSTVENGIGYQNRASTPIALDIPEEELMIHADTQKLVSLIENLVENASLHAEGVTQIKVRARKESSAPYVLCSIEDNGQGIPEEELSRLFERFYRVDKGRSRERGGTGLGLSIAREVVEAHGGEISASSLQGKGTSFSFRIPTLT
jgi:signal transduction histidine kinase